LLSFCQGASEPQVVDDNLREGGQPVLERGQLLAVDVQLHVPPGEGVDPKGQLLQVVKARRPAPAEVEPERPHPRLVEPHDLVVTDRGRQLRHPREARPEPGQRVHKIGLVEPLEGPGDDRATGHTETRDAGAVVVDGERVRQPALARDQGEARVDHVQVGVEEEV
jgi:hypothetical protein